MGSQDGIQADFSKISAPQSLMTTYLQNDPYFSQINLVGQYL
jgi:hypothetical protein